MGKYENHMHCEGQSMWRNKQNFTAGYCCWITIIDGIGARMCYGNGRDIPLHFPQMHRNRMALEAIQRLKSTRFPWDRIYPPPKGNYEKAQAGPISKIWPFAPPPSQQSSLQPQSPPLAPQPAQPVPLPSPLPSPPSPTFGYSSGDERRWSRGGYPKMES